MIDPTLDRRSASDRAGATISDAMSENPIANIPVPGDEWARALQEQWKAVQKAIGLTEKAGAFLGRIVGPAADALGGLLGDQMKSWRAANLNRLARKWERIRRERGLTQSAIRALPFGDAVRAIGAASLEEADEVQELWARLLNNATDPTADVKVEKSFIDVLNSIGANEAIVLDIFFQQAQQVLFPKPSDPQYEKFVRKARKSYSSLSNDQRALAFENLMRLRCVGHVFSYPDMIPNYSHDKSPEDQLINLSRKDLAQIIINISDELNTVSGWAVAEYERYGDDVAIINEFSLTPLGFALERACSVDPPPLVAD